MQIGIAISGMVRRKPTERLIRGEYRNVTQRELSMRLFNDDGSGSGEKEFFVWMFKIESEKSKHYLTWSAKKTRRRRSRSGLNSEGVKIVAG
ncbi:hypothetical protein LXL04_015306 [Taraxacum kok-saghyz]